MNQKDSDSCGGYITTNHKIKNRAGEGKWRGKVKTPHRPNTVAAHIVVSERSKRAERQRYSGVELRLWRQFMLNSASSTGSAERSIKSDNGVNINPFSLSWPFNIDP